eukprot:TRINITY_DN11452_c0_g1_i1.p1 TRINITY_DN11452_c0_g1~~TRINITY_DN11452_c0_g1_i1.p1  ORF type:complete len:387 (-),score=90.36 TRINITY_DN11452_c0_g1_i1:100-1260(-)
MTDIKTVGIMTCGGDCPGLNPVIRAFTITAISKYGWKVLGIEDSMQGLIDLNYKPQAYRELTLASVEDIIAKGGTILGSDNMSDPFRYPVFNAETGKTEEKDVSEQVIENFYKLGLEALVVVGGDGSMKIANKLRDKALKMGKNFPTVGVPKTIDNDLNATDYTFGFNTSVQTITEAIDKIQDTAKSHDRTVIVEVMGRDAGWLALHGGISSAAHVIVIPEIPYDVSSIVKKLQARNAAGTPFSIIVIAEGAKPKDGTASFTSNKPGEMARYSGAGDRLQQLLQSYSKEKNIKLREIRVSVLGYIQRGGSPSNFDRILGSQFGSFAAELVATKKWGHMCSLKTPEIVPVSFEDACKSQKLVDPNCQLIQTARSMGICLGDESGCTK